MVGQGVYVGNTTAALSTYESFMGHKADFVLNYLNDSSWKAFDDSIGYEMDLWKGASAKLILSVPLVVQGSTLAQAATGAFDDHYLKAAQALAASQPGTGPIYVRSGWEFNGSWMPWAAQGKEADFIKSYQNMVDVFRGVSDRFKFVWDMNIDMTMNPETAYPGDKYVDVVGMDVYYTTQYHSPDPQAAFNNFVNQKYGLQWQQDFAAAHGKQTAISEWGVQTNASGPFIKSMADWMNAHNMVFENYWDTNAANYPGKLDQGEYPDAAAAFKAAFPAKTSVVSVPAPLVDRTPPATPAAPRLLAACDTGSSSSDGITQVRTPTLTGATEAGAKVQLYDGTKLIGTAMADAKGAYAVTSAALSDGYHWLKVTATDAAGNTSALSASTAVGIDTQAPLLWVKTTGSTTSATSMTVSGTGEANATITLTDNGKVVGSTKVASNGAWANTFNFTTFGANSVVVSEADQAGNTVTSKPIVFSATAASLQKLASAAAAMPSSSASAVTTPTQSNAAPPTMLAAARA